MKNTLRPYHPLSWLNICTMFLLALSLGSCGSQKKKQLDERITLWRKDKIPYGTYVAYENIGHLFPNAEVSTNNVSPVGLLNQEGKKAYIIITPVVDPDDAETNAILNLAGQGNHIFISAFRIGDSLLHALKVRAAVKYLMIPEDTMQLSLYHPITHDSLAYSYPGKTFHNWVDSLDKEYTTITGKDFRGRPDLVRFTYKSGGSIMLHFEPIAFSNFFLLHKQNMSYYDNVFSYIPVSVNEVIWDDYFRYNRKKNSNFSALRYILNNRSLRVAFWLLLLLFLIIYLFESKRRQRMLPVIAGLRNNSLDFVRTIGRLYYQRRDHRDLATKMVTHFQDHIRTRYNLQAALADPGFVERLAYKTGIPATFLGVLVGDMLRLQDGGSVTDEELLAFNQQLEEFYKQA